MTRTFEIVENVVANLDLTTKVEASGNTLTTCDTLHLRKYSVVKDESNNTFRVDSVTINEQIVVTPLGSYTWSGIVLTAPEPTFLQGEWMNANSEYLDMSNRSAKKTPLIWLVRGYNEDHFGRESSIDFEVDPIIYFLDETPESGWLQDDHDKNAINPMYQLCEKFVKTLNRKVFIDEIQTYSIKDVPEFGVKVGNKGSDRTIIDDYFSGVELRVDLRVFDNCSKC